MTYGIEGERPPLKHDRDAVIDALVEHFANDVMEIDEFERLVAAAHAANTNGELKRLLHDLPRHANLPATTDRPSVPIMGHSTGYQVTTASNVEETGFILTLMGGGSRQGRWRPAQRNTVVTVMGGTDLDFREAVLGPGVTEVRVCALWGGVDIIVPPGLNVEVNGLAIMAGFDHTVDDASHDPMAPTLRVTGVACMAGVDIDTRQSGETARDARRRRKRQRREQRRRLRED